MMIDEMNSRKLTLVMMMMIRLGRRQLHTLTIFQQTLIKPSSPTPSHLQTYNLSPIDHFAKKSYLPLILFYPKNHITSHHKAALLKKSLSESLTQYYPLAGRMTTPTSPHVHCNDNGVVFLEARIDTHLDNFLNIRQQDESFYQLFANDLATYDSPRNTSLLGVQLNHFACGGIGLGVTMSHVIGDGATRASFLSHWASLARYGSSDHNPVFLNSAPTYTNSRAHHNIDHTNLVSRKFVFPNSKLRELKDKVVFEASRVEVLTSLLYKTAVAAKVTVVSDGFKPSYLFMMANVRDKFVQKLPRATFGNLVSVVMVQTKRKSETSLSTVVAEIQKHKLELEGFESVQHLAENLVSLRSKMRSENVGDESYSYWCSSLCGLGLNKVEFGWGKPVGVTPALRSSHRNGWFLLDSPDDDGIEAWVLLEKECMEVFENDKELLSFCKIV